MSDEVQLGPQTKCLVFKTNVEDKYQACRLVYVLEKVDGIINWNLDLEDWENVLRIEFSNIQIENLNQRLSHFDIEMEELPIW